MDSQTTQMSVEEFEAEHLALAERFGRDKRWGQDFAALLYRSGWNARKIHTKLGISISRAGEQLQYGRCLSGMEEIPEDLTITKFLAVWRNTYGPDPQRYREVRQTLSGDRGPATGDREESPAIGDSPAIGPRQSDPTPASDPTPISHFADGEWHPAQRIAKAIRSPDVEQALEGHRFEKKQVGPHFHYRMFPKGEISALELVKRLKPIIDKLYKEGAKRQEMATPAAVGILAHELEKLLKEWTTTKEHDNGET